MANPMNLTIPTVSVSPGPEYAESINADLALIAAHTHIDGEGNPVPVAGLDIDDDLPMNAHALTEAGAVAFEDLDATLVDVTRIYVKDGDLYYNNDDGVPIQLTVGTTINASAVGGFTGLAGTTGAATYNSGTGTFTFTSDTGVAATVATGPLVVTATDGDRITIITPTNTTNYTLELPPAMPASSKILRMTSTGVIECTLDVDGSSLEITGAAPPVLQVKALGIATSMIAATAVTRAKQAAVGQQVSAADSDNFTTSSTSYVDVTSGGAVAVAVTITTSGRPVIIATQNAVAGDSFLSVLKQDAGTGDIFAFLQINVTGSATTTLGHVQIGGLQVAGFSSILSPASAVWCLYAAAAGTYTFTLQAKVNDMTTTQFEAQSISLVAYEL